ncbi:High-affinity fructose transporter ght6 [Fulvia fulva]|uniref:High-affinity fructose transporter ght6 n=1 Tax=Passalora fulva TaxID=5499 RepID=A0A9Q8PK58_PASFU|nr:High-affinity fructose transporter ght6 [Fulvia fulva]KAK4612339.1 High-affinity fructose transporter ght6 [Fulvia fulva]KAK4612558.1 High-affinity fructose transporter ght6 [Fulvia fulva]UJO23912.1 High-affinity fructose transporter ght6 [Fulvia fulva]WPV21678.1 High-affinity fructose transporter ght6 [Fulvia fulva]WPV36060.1 High-affinity fructose transporter ght6 [Fulvia fulva]
MALSEKNSGKSSDDDLHHDNAVPAIPSDDGFDDDSKVPFLTARTFLMTILVSMGGICFGYDTGQISGFLQMDDFRYQFADNREELTLSPTRTGLIVATLSLGTLVGALIAGPVANNRRLGRKYSVCLWCAVFIIGNCFQIAAQYPFWWIMMLGRIISGFAIGGLSVMVPAYQGESAPTHLRGAIVCCYQLFITIGILIAYLINFGTEVIEGSASWRIPVAISYFWAAVLGFGILFFPETPRHEFRHGAVDSAAKSIAAFYGVSPRHKVVKKQLQEMQEKLAIEQEGGEHSFWEVFTGPRMLYRTLLGMSIQALQQMTGANFFFYYGTTIFSSVGLSNPFVTQIILGAVNVVTTFPGLYMVEKYGRRKCLTLGAAWMFMCFMVFASMGYFELEAPDGSNRTSIGYVMIVFACLFIAAFASTWGPMAWAVTSEIYPSRYRSPCIALCAASNWAFNFFIGFATEFIVEDIGFAYGYLFAACNFIAVLVVYFLLPETSGRSLEEIDTMFLLEIKPWKSSNWHAPQGENLITADNLRLSQGGRNILKRDEANEPTDMQYETVKNEQQNGSNTVAGGARGDSITAV